jgi:membrane protein YdbS with pleckstrin-like domain
LKFGKKFAPHPNLKKVYFTYLALATLIPMILALLIPSLAYMFAPAVWQTAWMYLLIPVGIVLAILAFLAWWIPKYYQTISFTLTKEEVVVERGLWWRMKHTVPYARVMSVDAIQGPISRRFGIGRVDIHTAGYTGPAGGTAGPMGRRAEAAIWGIPNFLEIRNTILDLVRGKPLFGRGGVEAGTGEKILEELRRIRKALEKP